MQTSPRISIVTPSYNQGKYLEETICSVLEQQYPNLEYIIIDGGSQDDSVEIIQKHSNKLAYWISEPDSGQSHAINKGFSRCTGDIIAWINSDDIYLPGTFDCVREYFDKHPEVDLVYGNAEIISATGSFLMHRKELPFDITMARLLSFGILIPQPAAFWRRNILDSVGYLNENLHYALDSDYWSRIAETHKIRHIPVVLAQARYHEDSKTMLSQKGLMPLAGIEIANELERNYRKLAISRVLPYAFAPLIRNGYRLKRIVHRFFLGHYFRGYFHQNRFNGRVKS